MKRRNGIPHLKAYSKDGVFYVYHRGTNAQLCPKHKFRSPEFFAAYAKEEEKARTSLTPTDAETLGFIIRAYKTSEFFVRLKPRTQKDYNRLLNWLSPLDGMPLVQIERSFLVKLRKRAFDQHGWKFANDVVQICSIVFEHALEEERVRSNPAKGIRKIPRPGVLGVPNRAWTQEEKEVVLRRAPEHLALPIAIARWTGLRQGDVLALAKTAFQEGFLRLTTAKRGVPIEIPCPDALIEAFAKAAPNDSIRLCANSRGKPWTQDGFRTSFFRFIRSLQKEGVVGMGLTFHGLRTSLAEELRSNELDDRTIADALAHTSISSTSTYLKSADRKRSLGRVVEVLNRNKA
jgi:integrase